MTKDGISFSNNVMNISLLILFDYFRPQKYLVLVNLTENYFLKKILKVSVSVSVSAETLN